MSGLVLSLFPGIGLLDRAFEEVGFCVVRGPDLLWGGDVRSFHPPAGRFDGVIGGPPCQRFSPIGNVNRARWGEDSVLPDLIPEFRRIVTEARPAWWVMENSPLAYAPFDECSVLLLDNAWLGEAQARRRCFWSNLPIHVDVPALVPIDAGSERTVSGAGSVDWKGSRARERPRTLADMLELQGFPPDMLEHIPFTSAAAKKAVGNGVPLAMGRAIATAVLRATEGEAGRSVSEPHRHVFTPISHGGGMRRCVVCGWSVEAAAVALRAASQPSATDNANHADSDNKRASGGATSPTTLYVQEGM